MRYAQIAKGQKLHLVFEPGEGPSPDKLTPAGSLSAPLCKTPAFQGSYRMNINVPLGNGCANCYRAYAAIQRKEHRLAAGRELAALFSK